MKQLKTLQPVHLSIQRLRNKRSTIEKIEPVNNKHEKGEEEEKEESITLKAKNYMNEVRKELRSIYDKLDYDDDEAIKTEELVQELSLEIDSEDIIDVRRECREKGMPLLEEYDFKKDKSSPDLPIELKTTTQIRDY